MGRPRTKRTLSAASTLRTGFCTFLLCFAPVIAQSPGPTCPQLSNLNITRIGHTLLIQRTATASSSHANDSSCICYPVAPEERSPNITCSTNFSAGDVCQQLPQDKYNVTKVILDQRIPTDNASLCLLSDCAAPDCRLYDSVPERVSIGELTSTFVNSSTVSVKWSVEGDPLTTTAKHFQVTWCAEEKNCSVETPCLTNGTFEADNATDTEYTFGDLRPATSLWVQVSPVGLQGNSSSRCFETSTEKLEPVTNLKPHLKGVDGLRVTWQEPKEKKSPTDYYEVRYCVQKGSPSCPLDHTQFFNQCSPILSEDNVSSDGYDIPGLQSDAILVIGITASRRYASGLEAHSAEVTGCFPTPSPGTIANLTAHSVDSTTAYLSWQLRQNPQQLLKPSAYNVTWCVTGLSECPRNAPKTESTCQGSQRASNRTGVEALELYSLHPSRAVIAEVRGLYTNGSDEIQLGLPSLLCFTTSAGAPGPPEDLRVTIIEARNATVSWEPPKIKNGPLDGYVLSVCAANNSAHLSCTKEAVRETVTFNDSLTTEYTLTDLQPWTNYTVVLVAFNRGLNNGTEMASAEATAEFQTGATAPGPPENFRITTVETTRATISWEPPKVKNGPLDGYVLSVCAANDSTDLSCTEEEASQTITFNDSLTTDYTLTGLQPWANYTLVLVAFNRDLNNGAQMASPEATAEFQTDASAPGSITKLSITEVTNTSIELLWSTPDFFGGNLDHYEVTHCKVERCSAREDYGSLSGSLEAPCRTEKVNRTSTQLANLEPWTLYEVFVAAVNELLNGTKLPGKAATLCQKTKEGVPGKVADMAVTTTSDTLLVKWKRPEAPRGEIFRYKIVTCIESGRTLPCGETFFVTGKNDTLEYGVQNRAPWTSYAVTLTAQNGREDDVLEGEAEKKIARTLPAAPSEPLNVVGTEEHGKFVNVSWEEPSYPRGPLDGYNVSWIIIDWLGRTTGQGTLVTTELSASITHWKPYSNYTFSVKGFNNLPQGGSVSSDAGLATFTTAVDVPGPPTLEWDVGSRSAAVYIGEPQYPNGPINGFSYCYCTASEECITKDIHGATCTGDEQTSTNQLLFLRKLRPWTHYKFASRAFNLDSQGYQLKGPYAEGTFKTDAAEPSAPVNFTLVKRESRTLFLNWSAPAQRNGDLEGYVVTWSLPNSQQINSSDVSPQNILIKDLDPYTQYEVEVRAYNMFRGDRLEGPTTRLLATTLAEAPGPVTDLTAAPFKNNTVRLTWRPPLVLRGELTHYIVRYNATKPGKPPMNDVVIDDSLLLSSCACKDESSVCAFEVNELPAEYTYTFDVRGRNAGVAPDGEAYTPLVRARVPPGDPPPPQNVSLVAAVDCPTAPHPESQKAFRFYSDMFDDRNGTITSYAIVVGPHELIRDAVSNGVSWKESQIAPDGLHVVTPNQWNPFSKRLMDPLNCSTRLRRPDIMCCIIGSEKCDGDRRNCNGPLKQGTEYAMYVIAYTEGGSRASAPEVFVTGTRPVPSSSAGSIVGGILTAILIMVIIIGVFILYRRHQQRQKQPTSKTPSTDSVNMNNSAIHLVPMSEANGSTQKPSRPALQYEPPIEMETHILKDINKPIPKKEFKEHFAMMQRDSGYRFADEYERLVELSPQYPSDFARHPANSKKNRFTNIHPFDKSRVPLSVIGNDEQTSYINASFVKGCNAEREYIAAQGPNALTVNDFWRMIWEHDVKIIVMLTQLVEGNKKKCERYWPEDNKEHSYGSVQVRKESTVERSDFILTELKIKSDDSSKWRDVRHVFFTAWKDHGTPESPQTLIRFVRTCQDMFGPRGGAQPPILVHCTAGVGRTGTFIALDMCLQKLEVEDDVDIFHLILDLRESRRCMVQNEKQYTYLYHCVDTVIDELCGRAVQDEPIYENARALMYGSTC